jgi:hypothetical protein
VRVNTNQLLMLVSLIEACQVAMRQCCYVALFPIGDASMNIGQNVACERN